jgi:hypothetical protein
MLALAVAYTAIEHWENLNRLPLALTRHITPTTTLWTAVIGLFLILGTIVEERLLDGRRDESEVGSAEPDVLLKLDARRPDDGQYDGIVAVPFTLFNAVDTAMNIKIESISTGDYVVGHNVKDGVPVSPILSSTTMAFPDTPELHADDPVSVTPQYDSKSMQFRMLLNMKKIVGLWWFIDRVYEHLTYEKQRSLQSAVSEEVRHAAIESVKLEHLSIPIRVTYWDRLQKRRWRRIETLHYEPTERRAYVVHGKADKAIV